MRQENNTQKIEPEKKERIAVWLYPSTLEDIDRLKAAANCKSRSEFLENAAQFYAGYISSEEATAYLPAALVAALRGTVQGSEDRIARLLVKLAVELDMMMNVMAVAMEADKDELERLRADCVRNVKRTSGAISFKDAVDLQCGARRFNSAPDEKKAGRKGVGRKRPTPTTTAHSVGGLRTKGGGSLQGNKQGICVVNTGTVHRSRALPCVITDFLRKKVQF